MLFFEYNGVGRGLGGFIIKDFFLELGYDFKLSMIFVMIYCMLVVFKCFSVIWEYFIYMDFWDLF